jgi:hypothetical protein
MVKHFLFEYYAYRAKRARSINARMDWERKMVRIHQGWKKKITMF